MKRGMPTEMNSELKNDGDIRERRNVRPMKRQFQKIRCHFCRKRDVDQDYYICSNYPRCRRGFCANCLRKSFKKLTSKIRRSNWQCPACEEICFCSRCLTASEQLEKQNGGIPPITKETKAESQFLSFKNQASLPQQNGKNGDQENRNTQLFLLNDIERECQPVQEKKCTQKQKRSPKSKEMKRKNSKKVNKNISFGPKVACAPYSLIPEEEKKLNIPETQLIPENTRYSFPSGFYRSQPLFQPPSRFNQTPFLHNNRSREFENPQILIPCDHMPRPQNWTCPFPLQGSINPFGMYQYPPNGYSNMPLINSNIFVQTTGQYVQPRSPPFDSSRYGIPDSN